MKKRRFMAMVLALLLLLMLIFTGCTEKEPEPLRICVDLEYVNGIRGDEELKDDDMSYMLETRLIEACIRQEIQVLRDIEVEYLPMSGTEREVALDRIRTEIMSGGGPDLFILACNEKDPVYAEEALFTMPEKAMELALFLPLDDYMENNTHFAEWDRMNQTVLAAGRNEEGQQIVPLCYRIPAAIYKADDVEHTASKELTWTDMIESEDIAFKAAAEWPWNSPMTTFILGGIADYQEEELLFTEAELLQRFDEITALIEEDELDDAPIHYTEYLGQEFDSYHKQIDGGRDGYTMIPLYSDDGGVTAEITAYTAINRNTKRPEDAYLLLDFMMSYSEQRTGHVYQQMIYTSSNIGSGTGTLYTGNIPMYDELMSENERIYWVNSVADSSMTGWCLSDENFAELCEVREQITNVKFRNELDKAFNQAYRDYYSAVQNGKDAEKVVTESYRNIQRMLRE